MGHRSDAFQADFDRLEEAVKLGEQAITFLGRIDCLVNNSGITFNKPFLEVTPKQFDRLYHVNVRAQYFLTQCVVQDMLTHDGSAVCNISSIHGVSGAPEHSVYAGTKGALIAQTRSLAVEMAHQGIRINAIAPGWVTVENYYKAIPGFNEEDARKSAADKVPLGRSGDKLEIAKLAFFFVPTMRPSSSVRLSWPMVARRRLCLSSRISAPNRPHRLVRAMCLNLSTQKISAYSSLNFNLNNGVQLVTLACQFAGKRCMSEDARKQVSV